MEQSEDMRETGERLLRSSADEDAQKITRAREESQWAWVHTLHATEARAREAGLQEGIKQERGRAEEEKIEIATSLLESEMSTVDVAKHVKLPLEVIKQLI